MRRRINRTLLVAAVVGVTAIGVGIGPTAFATAAAMIDGQTIRDHTIPADKLTAAAIQVARGTGR